MHRCGVALILWMGGAAAAMAAERYRPSSPDAVVLRLVPRVATDQPLERQVAQWLERARIERDPRYEGRAEALLADPLRGATPPAALLVHQADILQRRHRFSAAIRFLDRALRLEPGNPRARLMRAQLHLVSGEFALARPDCTRVIAAGVTAAGLACLAQAGAATGDPRALRFAELALARADELTPQLAAWAYGVRADIAQRHDDSRAAEDALRQGLRMAPSDEFIRVALADVLLARGAAREAIPLLDLARPSPGLLVRRVMALEATGQASTQALAEWRDLLALGARRGERHLREEAIFALDVQRDAGRALALAQANFELQKELIDVRLLARAARGARSGSAQRELRAWLRATGHRDVVVERSLT